MNKSNLVLNDIQNIIYINENSFTNSIIFCLITFILLLLVCYIIYKNRLNNKLKNKDQTKNISHNSLIKLDMNNTRKSAYILSIDGYKLISNEKQKKQYLIMNDLLKEYKYTKNIELKFDKNTMIEIRRFLKVIK